MTRISFTRIVCKSKHLYLGNRKKGLLFLFIALALCLNAWYHSFSFTRPPLDRDSLHHVTLRRTGGIIVLGMHRSGTSMLTGLLADGFGYHVGEPLMKPAFDNQQGFYELWPVIKANDRFLAHQNRSWWSWFNSYNSTLASMNFQKMISTKGDLNFTAEGGKALHFLNDPLNVPWVVKDPRLCITLQTWLPLLKQKPAVVFTYRHPLEVASSLTKRERFPLEYSFLMWIVYNMRAIQNSKGLCRIFTSHTKILTQPYSEVVRIVQSLEQQCYVVKPSKELAQSFVDSFVNVSLHHMNHKTAQQRIAEGETILQRFPYKNDGKGIGNEDDCAVFEMKSKYSVRSANWVRERSFYLLAMKIHCDFASGHVFDTDYEWPICIDSIEHSETCCSFNKTEYCLENPRRKIRVPAFFILNV